MGMIPTHVTLLGVEQPEVTDKSLSMRHSVPAFCQVLPSAQNLPHQNQNHSCSPFPQISSLFRPDCSQTQSDGLKTYPPSYFCALFQLQMSLTYSTIQYIATTAFHLFRVAFSRSQRWKYTCLYQT